MAVNAKDFSAAFFHISSLKNANTRNNTAASKQPNLFWFWEKYTYRGVATLMIAGLEQRCDKFSSVKQQLNHGIAFFCRAIIEVVAPRLH